MTSRRTLNRNEIIQALVNALKPLDYVHAFYEGGAIAFNRIDEWSDIDAYLVVDDAKISEAFLAVENVLKSLSPIQQKYGVPQTGWPGVFQAFYRLENASEYLIIDLAVLKLSSPDTFLEPEIHGGPVFHFNKGNKIKPPVLDRDAFAKKLQARLDRMQARFDMFGNFVQKELNRGNYLEAIELYYGLILASLVEALRIKHGPFHHDFKMRYIRYELPSEITERLKHLSFIKDEDDLQQKYMQAGRWFREIMSRIDRKEIDKLVKTQ